MDQFTNLIKSISGRKRSRTGTNSDSDSILSTTEKHIITDNVLSQDELIDSDYINENAFFDTNYDLHSQLPEELAQIINDVNGEEEHKMINESMTNENDNTERRTLSQLFTQILPDAEIASPNVVVIGAQNVGKTTQVRKMLFYYLIHNRYVTNEFGDKLLNLLKIGGGMVTRRPITITLQSTDLHECKLKLTLGSQTAEYTHSHPHDEVFDDILSTISNESHETHSFAYEQELCINVVAPGLPCISFTDLPGLVTTEKRCSDSNKSVRDLVVGYICRPNTTIVVVESASIDDFETSHVSPLLRDIERDGRRTNIFDHSILVLNKCDMIRRGHESRTVAMIDGSSPELKNFRYRHVVGVANQIFDNSYKKSEPSFDYESFKAKYTVLLDYEATIFERFLHPNLQPLDLVTECTTSAVFLRMEQISFDMVSQSLPGGITRLLTKLEHAYDDIRFNLAPSLSFYDQRLLTPHDLSNMKPVTSELPIIGNHISMGALKQYEFQPQDLPKQGRSILIQEFIDNFNLKLKYVFQAIDINQVCQVERMVQKWSTLTHLSKAQTIFHRIGPQNGSTVHDHVSLTPPPMSMEKIFDEEEYFMNESEIQMKMIDQLKKSLYNLLDNGLRHSIQKTILAVRTDNPSGDRKVASDGNIYPTMAANRDGSFFPHHEEDRLNESCFSWKMSPFHRMDRLSALCRALSNLSEGMLQDATRQSKKRFLSYLKHLWNFVIPMGIDGNTFEKHVQSCYNVMIETLQQTMKESMGVLGKLVLFDTLFVEDPVFIQLRKKYETCPIRLNDQMDILLRCVHVDSNETLRTVLEMGSSGLNSSSNAMSEDDRRQQFWVKEFQKYETKLKEERKAEKQAIQHILCGLVPPKSNVTSLTSTSSKSTPKPVDGMDSTRRIPSNVSAAVVRPTDKGGYNLNNFFSEEEKVSIPMKIENVSNTNSSNSKVPYRGQQLSTSPFPRTLGGNGSFLKSVEKTTAIDLTK